MATQAQLKHAHGEQKVYSAAGALTPGDVVVVGNRVGVVAGSKPVAVGDDYTLQPEGVFEMTALSTDVWADGDIIYWDDGNNRLTDIASTHKSAGIAVGAKASGETKALCDLNASVGSTTI